MHDRVASADRLIHTKLAPPRLHRRVLLRPALDARLRDALEHRLTVVQAGAGYGKTTALASLVANCAVSLDREVSLTGPLCWYTLDESDTDPRQFLSYLIGAFYLHFPNLPDTPWAILNELSQGINTPFLVADDQKGGIDSRSTFRPDHPWSWAIDTLINTLTEGMNSHTLLVLDDYHFVAHSTEITALVDRFITYLPPDLHVVIASRHPLALPGMITWRAKGQMTEIGLKELAFQPAEVAALFRDVYNMALSPADVAALADKTEGWPIALQMAWQGLRSDSTTSVDDLFAKDGTSRSSASLNALFDYLARDLLGRQPKEIADFMRETAVLRELTPEACDAVRTTDGQDSGHEASFAKHLQAGQRPHSAEMLRRLNELDLFIVALGEGSTKAAPTPLTFKSRSAFRYHHLFHDFLRSQAMAEPADVSMRHRRAAQFYQDNKQYEEAIYHWLEAAEYAQAAEVIETAAEPTIRSGRLDTVATWIAALPPDILADRPLLQANLGDVCRLRSRFAEALGWYASAEQIWRSRNDAAGISRAHHGQAMVYLDTVRPAEAESHLQEAVRLFERMPDRAARARLLELMAENKLNTGKPAEAEALRIEARALREEGPTEDTLSVRVKIRTGRLDEAQHILEDWAAAERQEAERGHFHPPRSHRETVLLLALIHALRGQRDQAYAMAQEGIALGERLNSPFVTAVAHMRLGHALQLPAQHLLIAKHLQTSPGPAPTPGQKPLAPGGGDLAIRCYETAIAIGDRLDVRRTRAEAMWGLTRAYGFFGDLDSAQRAATEGIEIARWAGDPWIEALMQLALGASYILAERMTEGIDLLSEVLLAFRNCGDVYGRAATRLWLAVAHHALRQEERLGPCLGDLLTLCETNGYDNLLTTSTFVGLPDPRRAVPLLIQARTWRYRPAYVSRLLAEMGLANIEVHPGYQLRVQTLGGFRLWRGETEVRAREWQRDKARQLFQLLLTERNRWLQRDEITDRLWPDLMPDAALRDFKVALNALNKAIEPQRAADAPFAFVVRNGATYRLRPEADLWLDAEAFRATCERGWHLLSVREASSGSANEEAITCLREGLALYQGDYLPDALYEDWASEERERLLTLYLRTADRLAAALIDRGEHEEGLRLCEAILTKDPCWERAYRLMMTAYARQGNCAQALRAYQRCVDVLRSELDVAPAAETRAFYRAIGSNL